MATPIPPNRLALSAFALRAALNGRMLQLHDEERECVTVVSDTRAVRPGAAFFALRGERFDGHAYLEAAIAEGASMLVVERGRYAGSAAVSVIEVDDTTHALGDLARAHLRNWRRSHSQVGQLAEVVAITGSAGKTTTKEFVAALLGMRAPVLATSGNLNNLIGLPSTLFGLTTEHRIAVLEAGMNVPGEIAKLAAIAEADVAIVTNIGLAHAGGVGGTRADVAREKGALFAGLRGHGIAVGNGDDSAVRGELLRNEGASALLFGRSAGCDVQLLDRKVSMESGQLRGTYCFQIAATCTQSGDASMLRIELPHFSEVHGLAIAAALATLCALYRISGLPTPLDTRAIEAALAGVQFAGRFDVHALPQNTFVVDDTYNANPQSMQASVTAIAELRDQCSPSARVVLVLGEMRELGARSEADHRALGRAAHASGAAVLISCGGDMRYACEEAEQLGVRVLTSASAEGANELARAHVRAGDWVLVKASRGVQSEVVVAGLRSQKEFAS